MRFLSYLFVLLCVVTGSVREVCAESPKEVAPWEEACRYHRSPRYFVRDSTRYCFRQPDQKRCQVQAQTYFERCGFSGDFQKISNRMSARMLLVLALSSVRSVHQLDL
ncbi:MAG: hypothetical protein RIS36_471 [Pseudomonadota bacterium]|jgi:hypothetical protein